LAELATLKAKTPKSFEEDLDAFMKKLDEVERQERIDEESTMKKLTKAAPASGKSRCVKTTKKGVNEKLPSDDGKQVRFQISTEVRKKYEKATATSKGIMKEKVVDEFDALVASKPAAPREKPGRRAASKVRLGCTKQLFNSHFSMLFLLQKIDYSLLNEDDECRT